MSKATNTLYPSEHITPTLCFHLSISSPTLTPTTLQPPGGGNGNVRGKVAAVTVTFAIAAIVPSLGLLLSLAGSLAGSLSSLILPGVMWGGIKGWTTTMAVVVGVGVCVGAGGATASIVEIVREGLK